MRRYRHDYRISLVFTGANTSDFVKRYFPTCFAVQRLDFSVFIALSARCVSAHRDEVGVADRRFTCGTGSTRVSAFLFFKCVVFTIPGRCDFRLECQRGSKSHCLDFQCCVAYRLWFPSLGCEYGVRTVRYSTFVLLQAFRYVLCFSAPKSRRQELYSHVFFKSAALKTRGEFSGRTLSTTRVESVDFVWRRHTTYAHMLLLSTVKKKG